MERETAARKEPDWRRMHRPTERERHAASEGERDRPLVLVVEDDPNDWEIYGKILWYNGFDVLCATDGAEALQFAQDYRPDLVLLDLGLPEMNGLDVCSRLKQHAATADVPVVVLTARPKARFGQEAHLVGCELYLEKPQSPLEVLHEVERVIGRAPPDAGGQPPEMQGH